MAYAAVLELILSLCLDGCVNIFVVSREEWEFANFLGCFLSQCLLCAAQFSDEWLSCLETTCNDGLSRGWAAFLNQAGDLLGSASLNHHDGDVVSGGLSLAALATATLCDVVVDQATSDDDFEQSLLVLLAGWECNPLSLWMGVVSNKSHAHATDWAGNWQAGEAELQRKRR